MLNIATYGGTSWAFGEFLVELALSVGVLTKTVLSYGIYRNYVSTVRSSRGMTDKAISNCCRTATVRWDRSRKTTVWCATRYAQLHIDITCARLEDTTSQRYPCARLGYTTSRHRDTKKKQIRDTKKKQIKFLLPLVSLCLCLYIDGY